MGGFNRALNLGGTRNNVRAFNQINLNNPFKLSNFGFNSAFNIGGKNNTASAGPGPLATAGTIGGDTKTAAQTGPGIKIK